MIYDQSISLWMIWDNLTVLFIWHIFLDFKEHEYKDELREAVNYGDGLVYVKTRSDNDDDIAEIFGVKFRGMSTNKDMTVNLADSVISSAGALQSKGKAVKTMIAASTAQGLATVKDKKDTYPVIVYNQYGRGKVILFSFDLLNSPDQNKVKELVINGCN